MVEFSHLLLLFTSYKRVFFKCKFIFISKQFTNFTNRIYNGNNWNLLSRGLGKCWRHSLPLVFVRLLVTFQPVALAVVVAAGAVVVDAAGVAAIVFGGLLLVSS